MNKKEFDLSKEESNKIVQAISLAEDSTSGEIRVHFENENIKDAYKRAVYIFNKLKMYKTEKRNGVLIYVNPKNRLVSIIGDEGINKVVNDNFWKTEIDTMIEYFKQDKLVDGIIKGIEMVGLEIKKYFPISKNDGEELSNKISTPKNLISIILWFLIFPLLSFGQNFPEKSNSYFNDYANIINQNNKDEIEILLRDFENQTKNEIVVVIINSLNGYAVGQYAVELAEKWGIGKKKEDNGILILIAPNERKINISTGYGVEAILTDAICKRIITNIATPYFKQKDYYNGIKYTIIEIINILTNKEYLQKNYAFLKEKEGISPIHIFLILAVLVIFSMIFFRTRNKNINRNGSENIWLLPFLLGNSGSSSNGGFGGFGGSGGGGGATFGGFGGGSFGGGGSSGSW